MVRAASLAGLTRSYPESSDWYHALRQQTQSGVEHTRRRVVILALRTESTLHGYAPLSGVTLYRGASVRPVFASIALSLPDCLSDESDEPTGSSCTNIIGQIRNIITKLTGQDQRIKRVGQS